MTRLDREHRTIAAMVRIFCHHHHHPREGLCADCTTLMDYANRQLDRCPFGAGKPACAKCSVHCYNPASREKIREIMRYAGPWMILRHPVLAIRHLLDKKK